ncbi:MAG TPA: NEW3 domain-containing protein, partial [Candidatus Limnocylindrales bacterium]|nr:NEW3 domain-containing protein [Candidatus Limnocylindrales bacterium]
VTVTPPSNVQAGTFPVQVTAASGSSSAKSALQVEIAGAPGITLGTPNNVLNTSVTSGGSGTLQVTVTNSGTAPLTGVTLSASAPTGWKVSFDPTTLDTLQPNDAKTVTATITPANNALAGDYSLTITGTAGSTTDSVDIRTTVETSPLWGFIGIGIIVIVLIGLGWVFRRYGRR